MITERLKFYADTPQGTKNKLFTWNVSILRVQDALFRFFARSWTIRAAWYEVYNTETGAVNNTRINTQELFDKFCDLPTKKKQIYINVQLKDLH